MKTLLLALAAVCIACGDGTPDPEADDYVKCSNFCGENGVKELKRSDSGYICFCYNQKKD